MDLKLYDEGRVGFYKELLFAVFYHEGGFSLANRYENDEYSYWCDSINVHTLYNWKPHNA